MNGEEKEKVRRTTCQGDGGEIWWTRKISVGRQKSNFTPLHWAREILWESGSHFQLIIVNKFELCSIELFYKVSLQYLSFTSLAKNL